MPARDNAAPLFISRRTHPRHHYAEPCSVEVDGSILRAKAINISAAGLSIHLRSFGSIGEETLLRISIQNFPPVPAIVRWTKGREVGLQFTEDLAKHPAIAALISRVENGESVYLDPRGSKGF